MSLLGELTYALITGPGRSIGTLIPDVIVGEAHRDELIITQHPVEGGGIISDHAFLRPVEVEMQIGYSDSTGDTSAIAGMPMTDESTSKIAPSDQRFNR